MTDIAWFNFMLVVTRVSSFFVTLPFMSYRGVPNLLKVFFALVVSYLIFLSSGFSYGVTATYTTFRTFLFIGGEVLMGLTMGLIVLLFFTAFRMAGQFMDVKIGLSMATIFDPQFGNPVTLLGQFYYLFAIIIYLTVNGHHYLFLALADSFQIVPLGGPSLTGLTVHMIVESFVYIWAISFQIAAPIVATVIITDFSLGLISKTVPQLHVFLVGLPLKVFLGLLAIYLTLPYLTLVMEEVFSRLYTTLLKIMESMA